MTKMPALAALSVLLLNCHSTAPPASPAPRLPEPVAAPAPAPEPESTPETGTGTEAETVTEPEPETTPETGTAADNATVPATRTAPPAHDPARCTLATRAGPPAWCYEVKKKT